MFLRKIIKFITIPFCVFVFFFYLIYDVAPALQQKKWRRIIFFYEILFLLLFGLPVSASPYFILLNNQIKVFIVSMRYSLGMTTNGDLFGSTQSCVEQARHLLNHMFPH